MVGTQTDRDTRLDAAKAIARALAQAIEKRGGEDLVALDVSGLVSYTDLLLVCTARNERMADAIREEVRTHLKHDLSLLPAGTEGSADSGWQIIDYLDCVLHIFTPEGRERYRLEHLWQDAPALDLNYA